MEIRPATTDMATRPMVTRDSDDPRAEYFRSRGVKGMTARRDVVADVIARAERATPAERRQLVAQLKRRLNELEWQAKLDAMKRDALMLPTSWR